MATEPETTRAGILPKLLLLTLIVAVVGLPINGLIGYAIVVAAGLVIFTGTVTASRKSWLLALVLTASAVLLQFVLSPQRIEEGHNVFVPRGSENVFTTGLPPDVYLIMAAQFDALYPPAQRCDPKQRGCWQAQPLPDRTFAFSADGIFGKPEFSRRVDGIDFSDPVWERLGFINDLRNNWYSDSDKLQRTQRDRRFWMGLHRWHVTMPYFVMYRFPADFAGSQLCWRGDLVWEEGTERFTPLSNIGWSCRVVEKEDIGRRIFGLAIKPATLAIDLERPVSLALREAALGVMILGVVVALLGMLVRWRLNAMILPVILIAVGLVVIAVDDASFIGGVRPFDGGDDGLYYDGVARRILTSALDGQWMKAIEGGERIFYYGGPGFRYLRALEHVIFGETYLGYLTLILFLPMAVFALFRRFVPRVWALACTFIFVAIPIGGIFGTSFFHYAKYASRGYADPAAAFFALCGTLALAGSTAAGPGRRFWPAFGAAFLFALSIFLRPNLAPYAGVILAGAGIAALLQRQWRRAFGLVIGFAPAAFMPWHNWYFGGEFVLFSRNAQHAQIFLMPPSSYWMALVELLRFDLHGAHLRGAVVQIANWLSGPAESYLTIPLGAASIVIVVFVIVRDTFSPWLRLIALATLAQHGVMLIYATTQRYHLFTWLMTFLIVVAWLHAILPSLRRRFPGWWDRTGSQPALAALGSALSDFDSKTSGVAPSASS